MKKYLKENTCAVNLSGKKIIAPMITQNTRQLLKKIVEDFTPSEGIFYIIRNPDGWVPFSYRFDEFPEIDHINLWEDYVCPILVHRWAATRRIKQQDLSDLIYAFPRGRVVKNGPSKYCVYHGNDFEKFVKRPSILKLFSLPSSVKFESDSHEKCLAHDVNAIRSLLGIKETWPAVSDMY